MIDFQDNLTIKTLQCLSNQFVDIETTENGLMLIRGSIPSKTTHHKIELIAKFLSSNKEEIRRTKEGISLISALKEKLIREADGNGELILKVKELSFFSHLNVDKSSPCILIVESSAPKTAEQFLKNMNLFVKHPSKYVLGNNMEVLKTPPKGWEPEKLLTCFRIQLAQFSKYLLSEQITELENTITPLIKPLSVVKFGLVFESKDQTANIAMFLEVYKLLMHKIPVIINREFMLAHRHRLINHQIPLQYYHQKGGTYSLIIPVGAGSPKSLGFNEKELIQGSLKDLLPLEEGEDAQSACLDRLLVAETADRKFARVNVFAGHGASSSQEDEGTIAGLSFKQCSKVKDTLNSKGVKFEILITCHGAGSNLEILKATPYPMMVMSSSEISSLITLRSPSYAGILDYASDCLQKGPLGVLMPQEISERELLEANREFLQKVPKGNSPTLIFPKMSLPKLSGDIHGLKRLQDRVILEPIQFEQEEDAGFIPVGGTGHHIIREVNAENVTLKTIAKNTFSVLDLSKSSTRKTIFISRMKCLLKSEDWFASNLEKVAMYANDANSIFFSVPGYFYGASYFFAVEDLSNATLTVSPIEEEKAISLYYFCFAATLLPNEPEGKNLLPTFQKEFFGDASSTLHNIYSILIQASFDEKEDMEGKFTIQLRKLKEEYPQKCKSILVEIKNFTKNFNLDSYEKLIDQAFTSNLIQRIQQQDEAEILELLQSYLDRAENPLSLLSASDIGGKTPLYWAMHLNKMALVYFLIPLMVKLSRNDPIAYWDIGAFFEACRQGNEDLVRRLLNWGNFEKLPPEIMIFALRHALKSQSEGLIQLLIEFTGIRTGNVVSHASAQIITELITDSQHRGLEYFLKQQAHGVSKEVLSTALIYTFVQKDIKSMEILISFGADPNVCDHFGQFPLIALCFCPPSPEQVEMFQLLNKVGVKLEIETLEKGKGKKSPLLIALAKKSPLVEHLIKNGVPLNTEEFWRACLDRELMKMVIHHSTLEQLEKNASTHPLTIALCAQDFETANALIDKGVAQKIDRESFISEYLAEMKQGADIKVLDWIMSRPELHMKPLENQLFGYLEAVIGYSSWDVIQYFESKLEQEYGLDIKKWDPQGMKSFLAAIKRKFRFNLHLREADLSSDQKSLAEAQTGPQESHEKILRHFNDRVEDFGMQSEIHGYYFIHEPNLELRKDLLSSMINKCPYPSFKDFYSALMKGDTPQTKECIRLLSDSDIAQIWAYCPPPFIIASWKKPSEELVKIVVDQMQKAQLNKLDKDYRTHLLAVVSSLCKEYPDIIISQID